MEEEVKNERILRDMKYLIEGLSHSGDKDLNKHVLKRLVEIWQLNNWYIDQAILLLFKYLEESHSEVRYSCVQLINELFVNFEASRKPIGERLSVFLDLAFGDETNNSLPPPFKAANNLKKLTILIIKNWYLKYGKELTFIRIVYNHLKIKENVDFDLLEVVDPKQKKKKLEAEKIQQKINKERLERSKTEIKDLLREIEESVKSLDTCFSLLIPDLMLFNEESPSTSTKHQDLRLFGIVNYGQSVEIDLQICSRISIAENNENSAVIENAQDVFKVMSNKQLPKIDAWIQLIKKTDGDSQLLTECIEQKIKLENALLKFNKLEFKKEERIVKVEKSKTKEEEDIVSTDSEMEEVHQPVTRITKKSKAKEDTCFLDTEYQRTVTNEPVKKKCEISKGDSNMEKAKQDDSTLERKKKLLSVAPKLPFDIDLYHWEDEKLPIPTMIPVNTEGHSFWSASKEELNEVTIPGGSSLLRSRVIEFTGEFKRVERSCKAPLPSGKLCPRHDRIKCPLHGIIVPRDESGKILNQEDEKKVKKITTIPDWQDPKLLAEIKATTGIDLKMPEKGHRGKKKKFPGLTDLRKKQNTPKTRIGKKIFNRVAVKRVASVLDKIDHKKFRDKFGDQFNYVHGSS